MKIQGTPVLQSAERVSRSAGRVSVDATSQEEPASDVTLAGGARFMAEVRAAASTFSELRALEVVRAQEDVRSGEILTDAEIEAAVDGLLAGL